MSNTPLHSMAINPIFARLTRRSVPLRIALWTGAVCGLLSMLVGMISGFASSSDINIETFFCGFNLALSIPVMLYGPIIAAFAAIITSTDVQSENYAMLKLTLVTPQQIVTGYVFAALRRLSMLHAIVIGLSFVGMFELIGVDLSDLIAGQSEVTSQLGQFGANTALFIIGFLRVIGRGVLAATFGVSLSLLWRRRGMPSLMGMVAAVVMITLQVAAFLVEYLFTPSYMSSSVNVVLEILQLGYGMGALTLLCVPALGMMRLAQRWA